MELPVMPPVRPMLAKPLREVPRTGGLCYEPKWDGFRCVVFRDGDEVELGSRNDRPLTRYFPELVDLLRAALPPRCVVDGEIVLVTQRGLDFGALQLRLHPAASRVRKLAAETPASFVAFDLLALGEQDLTGEPFARRRELLEDFLGTAPGGGLQRVHLTPLTTDPDVAQDWFTRFEGAGFDGVMAKPADQPYEQDRRVMWKVKHERTADCVVAGFRWHKDGQGVGSLLLGLYDETGTLHHVGVASSFTKARRGELVEELAPWRENALEGHPWRSWAEWEAASAGKSTSAEWEAASAGKSTSAEQKAASAGKSTSAEWEAASAGGNTGRENTRRPGANSRWAPDKDLSWEPLRPERVAEVRYEHLQGDRFRHGGRLVRFRPDREPRSCTYAQLEEAPPAELTDLFGEAR
ncbi:ATP-dependent DNA ligase [Amycolatopsis jiangsuensis]|uniref:ATP-dependent DNA ligase n=1 Tax=Amycolatopsis jiangsuensis TaxID=1181879 RepID=A0A840IS19_9PSEU|nr:ATP-dependent DNA ligase [Amycolatopsis jiangsuensis]MBB4684339.1 ATP-dependent DNA ligase [Amycolatopsis jiangsuensis]